MTATLSQMPLTLALSPRAGRGDDRGCRLSLLPACGEKVADRPDEGQACLSMTKII